MDVLTARISPFPLFVSLSILDLTLLKSLVLDLRERESGGVASAI